MTELARGGRVVDCDVHCTVPTVDDLFPYLSEHWPEYLRSGNFAGPLAPDLTYPPWAEMVATTVENTGLDSLRADVLDHVDAAILHCYYGVESLTHPYLAPELATAVNRWVEDEWLGREPGLRAAASITPQFVDAAVREIERIADDGRFVEILLPVRSQEAYGAQRYWPIWEAAARHGLVLGITFGGVPGVPPTPVNWTGTYFEDYVACTLNFQTQLNSFVMSGVFQQWPDLRVTMMESGWTWLSGFMWRMDSEWKQYKREVPWLEAPPSTYVRRHFRFTTQPTDAPRSPEEIQQLLGEIGGTPDEGADLLIYASDHPHRSSAADFVAVMEAMTEEQRERIMWRSASEWYGLGQGSPPGPASADLAL